MKHTLLSLPARAGAASLAGALTLAPAAQAQLNCNVGVEFHANGGIASCVLNGDHRIYTQRREAIVCADGARTELHADGKLARCTLRHAVRVADTACAAGADIVFDTDGAFERCEARQPR